MKKIYSFAMILVATVIMFSLNARAVTMTLTLSQTTTSGPVGTNHTVMVHAATLGNPATGVSVNLSILSGPNTGITIATQTTDGNGDAYFTYTGNGGPGIDELQAHTGVAYLVPSNTITFEWIPVPGEDVPTLGQWGLIIFGLALIGVGTAYIMRKRGIVI